MPRAIQWTTIASWLGHLCYSSYNVGKLAQRLGAMALVALGLYPPLLLNTSQLVSTFASIWAIANQSDAVATASRSRTCIGDVTKAFASVVREN